MPEVLRGALSTIANEQLKAGKNSLRVPMRVPAKY